jgi:uncharacterized protein (TIRG00374 family)
LKKGLLQALKITAFIILGLILIWIAFRKTNFSKLADDLKRADYSWLLLSMVFGFIAYVSRARRWVLLINPLGYKPSLMSTYHALMTGYLANLALPRIGEVTRCVALGKKEKIPVDQLLGTVIIERTVDFITVLLLLAVILLTSSDQIMKLLNESFFIPLHEKIVKIFGVTWIMWAALFTIGIVAFALTIKYRSNLRKFRFFDKMFRMARGIINGLKSITSLERKWEFIFHSVFIWINYALMTWVVVFALKSTSGISFSDSIIILVIGGLAMSAPVQGGFGVFHYAVSRTMIIIAGVSMEDGLAYAVLTHESQLILAIFLGAISFFLFFRMKKIHPLHPLDDNNSNSVQ